MYKSDSSVFLGSLLREKSVPVPPINLLNVDTVFYLFGAYPYLINAKQHGQPRPGRYNKEYSQKK